jgi:hypothetical protein
LRAFLLYYLLVQTSPDQVIVTAGTANIVILGNFHALQAIIFKVGHLPGEQPDMGQTGSRITGQYCQYEQALVPKQPGSLFNDLFYGLVAIRGQELMQQSETVYPVKAGIRERQSQGIAVNQAEFNAAISGNQALGFNKTGIGRIQGKDIEALRSQIKRIPAHAAAQIQDETTIEFLEFYGGIFGA